MKFTLASSIKRTSTLAAFGLLTGLPISAQALDWAGGSGDWTQTGGTQWSGGAWIQNSDARFTTGSGTVSIKAFAPSLDIQTLVFTSGVSGTYIFDNDPSGALGGGTGTGSTINISGGISQGDANSHMILNSGDLNFTGTATSGNANIVIKSDGGLNYKNSSSAGGATITNFGNLEFADSSSGGSGAATVDNRGNMFLSGTSSTGLLGVQNGGTILLTSHSGPASLATVNNFSGGFAGAISTDFNKLNLNGLTLANVDPSGSSGLNSLGFTLSTPSNHGQITIAPGGSIAFPTSFTGAVDIAISGGNIAAGTYTLIDWTGATATGLTGPADISDFVLDYQPGTNLSGGSHLELQGSSLVLVAVPEPATLAMPLAACLGLLGLRRRASRAVLAQA